MASRLWRNSLFQQSDQLSETPAAGCHRKNVLPYTGLPQCDEHVEEGSVRKELPSKPSVGTSFPMWVRVFNLHFPDTMTRSKSCRHKRYRNLILTDFEPELFEFWVHVFNP